ncbi:IPT/TIG domain-containing protein [Methanospirillum hungatei]|uniref:IPT/TIG domain-containing protein n=1 Tax=Methanospirillum hungatei TaxID=2203 RepID=UPI0026E94E51|nr:IPT/TIG domain-containing protein [Methanospirillum hungatei]MCA1917549.1 IPT/TIG domain-containing protein [Methanospirillum hungatei]
MGICTIGVLAEPNLVEVSDANDSTLKLLSYEDGRVIEGRLIGPGLPPENWDPNKNLADLNDVSAQYLDKNEVPAMSWSYGCAPTSATMLFGYLDRNGYPNMYTGPTNGGVFPLTNAVWGPSFEGNGQCPLTASQNGLDGRTTKGHKDDYYHAYGSNIDPYFGSWTEHTPQDSLGDFMGTSMYNKYQSTDGGTWIWTDPEGFPLYDYTTHDDTQRDGMHGMKLFVESRGYSVANDGQHSLNYNQLIYGYNGNTNGFTYDQYKAEIDAGYPVLIQVRGHTMLGVGYTGTDQIIIHNTWDYNKHTMTWGGSYEGMQHYAVGVIHLNPAPTPTPTPTPTPEPAPIVSSITPDSGEAGSEILYTITGTNFLNGAIINLTKTDETNITSIGSLNGKDLTGTFTIPPDATLGSWNVSVNQNGRYSNDDILFTITAPPVPVPVVTGITPESGQAGFAVNYTIIGSNLMNGAWVNLSREGQTTIASIGTLKDETLTGTFYLPVNTLTGPWNVSVNQNGQVSTDNILFTITPAPTDTPVVTLIHPDNGEKGTEVIYSITGEHLLYGAIVNLTHDGEENITSYAYIPGPGLFGSFKIPSDALTGPWNVSVNQNGLYSNDDIQFTITDSPIHVPVVHNITPDSGLQGESTDYLLQGENFKDGALVNLSHPEQGNITSTGNLSEGNLTGTITIPDDALPGPWNVTVNQSGLFSNDNVQFIVLPSGPFPVVHSVVMSFAAPGKGSGFVVYGENFENGAIVNLSHPGEKNITAIGELVKGTLTGTFMIPESCRPGLWNVTVNVKGKVSNDNIQYPIKGKLR